MNPVADRRFHATRGSVDSARFLVSSVFTRSRVPALGLVLLLLSGLQQVALSQSPTPAHASNTAKRFPMSDHHCHALGCKAACPPRWLMCRACWALVPSDLATEVYRTVKLRGPCADASWAPWWRAQARAIAHVAFLKSPIESRRDAYLARELAVADRMASRDSRGESTG
jgi:hypothetical protein